MGVPSTAHLHILSGTAQIPAFPAHKHQPAGVFGPPRQTGLLCCVPKHSPPAGNDSLAATSPDWLRPPAFSRVGLSWSLLLHWHGGREVLTKLPPFQKAPQLVLLRGDKKQETSSALASVIAFPPPFPPRDTPLFIYIHHLYECGMIWADTTFI